MRKFYVLALVLAATVAGTVSLAITSSASAAGKTTTLKLFFKEKSMAFKSPSGAKLTNSSSPAAGDYFSETIDAYTGTSAHHTKKVAAGVSLECVVTQVISASNLPGVCDGTIAIGNSQLIAIFPQNVANNIPTAPITGGTGVYAHAKGTVTTKRVGKTHNSNAVVKFTT